MADFHVLQDQASVIWGKLVLTWKASFRNCFGRFALRSPEITYAKELSFALETFYWMKNKLKKPFFSLSLIYSCITMLISYYSFVSTSYQGTERGWCEFVLLWHRFDTRSVNFVFGLFLYLFQKPKHLFKENMLSKLLKVIV